MKTLVTKSFTFEAAHQLPWHPGKCKNLHGHTYRLEVSVRGPLTEDGIVMDFADLAAVVQAKVVQKYDHQYLNEYFENPTAELLAVSFHKELEAESLQVSRLTLWETANSSVTVEEESA
jgi:6-pyruvoyltetrahydropterin/6-carboxytetrahydropterin synthase